MVPRAEPLGAGRGAAGRGLACQRPGRRRARRPPQAALNGLWGRPAEDVQVTVENAQNNGRCLYAGVSIEAPSDFVWGALTDYDGLGNFIPGLAVNQCLSRQHRKARLLQVGEQDIALGAKFKARLIIEVEEHPEGLPQRFLAPVMAACILDRPSSNIASFPRPRSPLPLAARTRDLSFKMEEGDFTAFRGVWRMQDAGSAATRLSYALFVRPQPWLPVALIQSRIKGEIQANLRAVRRHSERLALGRA